MKSKAGRAAVIGVVFVGLVGCGAGSVGSQGTEQKEGAASSAAGSAPAQERLSSEYLQSRWWTWAASEPEGTNPVADQDGRSCGRNQARDVWFLAGSFGGQVKRSCKVPSGVPLAFPLVNLVGEPSDCEAFMDRAKGTAVLDGKEFDPEEHRGAAISVRAAVDNPVTQSAGTFTTTGCGLWVQMEPLEPGQHTLKIRGESAGFSVGVDYSVSVEDGSK
ncbi:signal protein [Streptomyces sp. NBC_00299]|uniref:signal protein n=1 Tax=Streptomyces sp. NBC_00299 TaxID=2975705 RepID=UPI002E2D58A9|nr:signal protein [Streptomyces sp. NBC_00299]